MTRSITKNKITINSVIEFVHKAMVYNLPVSSRSEADFGFIIENGEDAITFIIKRTKIEIFTPNNGFVSIDNILTNRDEVDLKTLEIDIKEYNEEKAVNSFNNFFADTIEKPVSINDLDNEDD